MEKNQPSYFTILPASVRYDKNLTDSEKILFSEIVCLCNMNGKCHANNQYFMNLYGVSKVTISKRINRLVKTGHLKSVLEYHEGTKQVKRRYLSILAHPMQDIFNRGVKDILKDNSNKSSINNTSLISGYSFEEFWIDYDKKVGDKENIQKKFENISESNREKIKNHIPEYKQAQPEKKFRKNPSTYLNQKGWTDEIIQSQSNNFKNGQSHSKSQSRVDKFLKSTRG